jgi:hypothetical protein
MPITMNAKKREDIMAETTRQALLQEVIDRPEGAERNGRGRGAEPLRAV